MDNQTLSRMASEPYEARGILHSEMALIIRTCLNLGVEVVIESGRARGQSTYMLAKYLPGTKVHSVELRDHPDEIIAQERLSGFANLWLWAGDGNDLVPYIARKHKGKRMAILLDGPKGAAAVDILARSFEMPHVAVGFIHDMRRLDHGGPSPHRAVAVERLPNHAFSDEPAYDGLRWMDDAIIAGGGPAGPAHEAEFGSYGPTIGIFFNPAFKH